MEFFVLLLFLLFLYGTFGIMVPLSIALLFAGFLFYKSQKFEAECKQREDEIRHRIKNSHDPSEECSKICHEIQKRSEEINRQWEESQKKQNDRQFDLSDVALGWLLAKLLRK